MKKYLHLFLLSITCCGSLYAFEIDKCGKVIAHENGFISFIPKAPIGIAAGNYSVSTQRNQTSLNNL